VTADHVIPAFVAPGSLNSVDVSGIGNDANLMIVAAWRSTELAWAPFGVEVTKSATGHGGVEI
jgi:hypothetical protein